MRSARVGDTPGAWPEDFDNFKALLTEFRAAIIASGQPFLLTAATPAAPSQGYIAHLQDYAAQLDWMSCMNYDYHGPGWENITGANAPLNQDSVPGGTFDIKDSITTYLKNGVEPQKILLGLASYGHNYAGVDFDPSKEGASPYNLPFTGPGPQGPFTQQAGFLSYQEILLKLKEPNWVTGTDAATNTAWAYNTATKELISYDSIQTLDEKIQFIRDNNLLGAMGWAVDYDDVANGFPFTTETWNRLNPSARRPKRVIDEEVIVLL